MSSTIPEKIPVIKLEDERIRYEGERLNYIDRVFITKRGDGTRGIWEYIKCRDLTKIHLTAALICIDSVSQSQAIIIKKEKHISTYEGTALSIPYLGMIDDAMETYGQHAVEKVS